MIRGSVGASFVFPIDDVVVAECRAAVVGFVTDLHPNFRRRVFLRGRRAAAAPGSNTSRLERPLRRLALPARRPFPIAVSAAAEPLQGRL